jgi:hypothetical protein
VSGTEVKTKRKKKMKKIIMAAAIVCAAVCAQASTVNWGLSAAIDATTFASGTAYLVCVTDLAKPSLADDAAAQAWFTANSATLADKALLSGTIADGMISGSDVVESPTGRKNYYLVLVNEDNTAMAVSTTTKAINIQGGTMNATAKWDGASQMTSYALVPEPTSGLLMLVGLGALALRRRRA